ncbi:hypothetical protein [Embleya sp. NPDC050493]|uniref:hypothetical protein n=1 Tax=Embleya sp. NPDC050493 TaxID=3363989 RepID=UPI0037BD1187
MAGVARHVDGAINHPSGSGGQVWARHASAAARTSSGVRAESTLRRPHSLQNHETIPVPSRSRGGVMRIDPRSQVLGRV